MASKYRAYVKAYNQRASKKRALDKAQKKQDKAHNAYLADVKKRVKKRRRK